VPSRLPNRQALVLAGLLIAMPSESIAQHYGARSHGGGGHGGGGQGYQRVYGGGYGGYRPYQGYGGYPGYYGYGGYYGNDHHDNDNGVWIAIGAGILGFVLGSAVSQRQVPRYGYPSQAPPPTAPTTLQCPDGSTIPVGSYCPAPPPAAPAPPMGERG